MVLSGVNLKVNSRLASILLILVRKLIVRDFHISWCNIMLFRYQIYSSLHYISCRINLNSGGQVLDPVTRGASGSVLVNFHKVIIVPSGAG
jgi:hypothetical protein